MLGGVGDREREGAVHQPARHHGERDGDEPGDDRVEAEHERQQLEHQRVDGEGECRPRRGSASP